MDDFIIINAFLCVFSLIFFILGVSENVFPRNLVFHMLAVMVSYTTSLVTLGMTSAYSIVFSLIFFFMGTVSMVFIIVISVMALRGREQNRWKI